MGALAVCPLLASFVAYRRNKSVFVVLLHVIWEFPMKIDSVIIGFRDGKRFYVAKDQIPEIHSKPNSKYKIRSFEAHILIPYIIVDMNMGDFSVNFKGKQNR